MINWLKGKKTYIVAVLAVAVNALYYTGKIDKATFDVLIGLLGAGAISTISAKINRIANEDENYVNHTRL